MHYNIVLVSTVQQSESVICLHISYPSWTPLLPPHITALGHLRALSSMCFIEQLSTSYLFYTWSCIYVSATLSILPTRPFSTVPTSPFSTYFPTNRFISNLTTEHIPWENHSSKRYMYPSVHCSTICIS